MDVIDLLMFILIISALIIILVKATPMLSNHGCTWIFGDIKENIVHLHEHDRAAGFLQLEKARVRWFLSITPDTLPEVIKQKGMRTFRSIKVDGLEFEFSGEFT